MIPVLCRAHTSKQPKNTAISPVVSHPRHHGSRTSKLHAQSAVKVSNSGPCSEAYQRPQCISRDSLQLPVHQPGGAERLAPSPSKKVPELDLLCVKPSDSLYQGQQEELHETQRAQQESHEAQHEADIAQQEPLEAHTAQQTILGQSPHTARSSQSDATHLDHHDSYRSNSSCQDACQSAQTALDTGPHSKLHLQQASAQQHQPPVADATLLAGDSNVFQDKMSSCRYDDTSCFKGLASATDELNINANVNCFHATCSQAIL